jgi:hypothetical protein
MLNMSPHMTGIVTGDLMAFRCISLKSQPILRSIARRAGNFADRPVSLDDESDHEPNLDEQPVIRTGVAPASCHAQLRLDFRCLLLALPAGI